MAANDVLGIIFSNSYDEVIPELTALRTMGSVPFAGRYRLIDFPLSKMVNAGISLVGVITSSNYRSLMDHIGTGKPWDLSRKREGLTLLPPFSVPDTGMFRGKVDSLYGSISYISESGKDYVLIADTNLVSDLSYEKMLKVIVEKDADVIFAAAEGMPGKIKNAIEYVKDGDNRITELRYINDFTKPVTYSLKTMIIKRSLLERLLHEANAKRIYDFEALFAANIKNLKAYSYIHKGYVKIIESVSSFYEANLDILKPEVRRALFNPDSPVYTKTSDRIPAYYGISAQVENSFIADGCKIEGKVENCILFRGVRIAKGAVVRNSIIMQNTIIEDNANLECIITDKDVIVKSNRKLCGAPNYPVYIGKGISV